MEVYDCRSKLISENGGNFALSFGRVLQKTCRTFTLNGFVVACLLLNDNHFVDFAGATFELATHVYTLACIRVVTSNMKIYSIANIL